MKATATEVSYSWKCGLLCGVQQWQDTGVGFKCMAGRQRRSRETPDVVKGHTVDKRVASEECRVVMWAMMGLGMKAGGSRSSNSCLRRNVVYGGVKQLHRLEE